MQKIIMAALAACLFLGLGAMNAAAADQTSTVQAITVSGSTPSYTGSLLAGTTTYGFQNDGSTFLHFKKSGVNACTVTIHTTITFNGFAVADATITVGPDSGDVMVGPFPKSMFNNAAGTATFAVSEATGLTVAVLKL